MRKPLLFLLATAISACSAAVIPVARGDVPDPPIDDNYPLPHKSSLSAHDPNIIKDGDYYYLFKGGIHIPFYRSKFLKGRWEKVGTVLDEMSVIKLRNRKRPWAPTVVKKGDTFYCYYALSQTAKSTSAIGVLSSKELKPGTWTDHGALIKTGKGVMEKLFDGIDGIDGANAIDPSIFKDPKPDGKWYLNYGSFFSGIWQIQLSDDMLSVDNEKKPDPSHLQHHGSNRLDSGEGSFMSYKEPHYYLWFSRGNCCHFPNGKPVKAGHEYSIHVGRSSSPSGPFFDKYNHSLTEGGGHEVYGTNHDGNVYAPGGIGVLSGEGKDGGDILYYHYLNLTVGLKFKSAQMGWSYLDYEDGWPVVSKDQTLAPKDKPEQEPTQEPKPEPSSATATASSSSSSIEDKPTQTPDPTSNDPPKPTDPTSSNDEPKPTDPADSSQSSDGESTPTPEVTPSQPPKNPDPTSQDPPSSTKSQPPKQDPPPSSSPTPLTQPQPQSTTLATWIKIITEIIFKQVPVTKPPAQQ